jgi:cytochrome bd-type quinol oxidase subunit 2
MGRLEERRMNDANSPWLPPDAKQPAPTATSFEPPGPSWSRGMLVAAVGAAVGWGIVVFFALARLLSGEETNCTARRGTAYQDCLRSSDLNGLGAQALAFSLAVMGCVLIAREARRSSQTGHRQSGRNAALALSGSLLAMSILLWIWGLQGGWAPDRPFDYEPVPHSTANAVMLTALLIGTVVGRFWPLARTTPARAPSTDRR